MEVQNISVLLNSIIDNPRIEPTYSSHSEFKELLHEAPPNTPQGFIQTFAPLAKIAAKQLHLDPKILLAQAALETGWGRYIAKGSANLFNIKSTNSKQDAVEVNTTEFIDDEKVNIKASFRKYASVQESFADYVALIKNNERYQKALSNTGDPERYLQELQKAGYATDPKYCAKILAIYYGAELSLYTSS